MKLRTLGAALLAAGLMASLHAAPLAYVPNEKSGTVSIIDTATDTVVKHIKTSERPRGIAIAPDGSRLYLTNSPTESLIVVDLASDTPVAQLMWRRPWLNSR